MTIVFDFATIGSMDDFYDQLQQKLSFADFFGRNLDALYDTISGDLPMPLLMEFTNFPTQKQAEFAALIDTLKDLEEDMNGFSFKCRRKK